MTLPNETSFTAFQSMFFPEIGLANHRSARASNAPSSNLASQPPNLSSHPTATRDTSTGFHTLVTATPFSRSLSSLFSDRVSHPVSFREPPRTCDRLEESKVRALTKATMSFEAVVLSWPMNLETGRPDGTRCCGSPSKMRVFECLHRRSLLVIFIRLSNHPSVSFSFYLVSIIILSFNFESQKIEALIYRSAHSCLSQFINSVFGRDTTSFRSRYAATRRELRP
jgi:hypothetical protein